VIHAKNKIKLQFAVEEFEKSRPIDYLSL